MRLRHAMTRLFGRKLALESPPTAAPFLTRAASAEEMFARLADVDYELYGRDSDAAIGQADAHPVRDPA